MYLEEFLSDLVSGIFITVFINKTSRSFIVFWRDKGSAGYLYHCICWSWNINVLYLASDPESDVFHWRNCESFRLFRDVYLWSDGTCIDPIWTSSCILSPVLADIARWNDGSCWENDRWGTKYLFAQLADPATTHFNVEATRFMAGKFPLMIFGLPGAAFAIYRCARPEQRKVVGGLMISAALTSMLTGITEPLEFTFLFIAPGLYGIHCVFAGLAYMMMHVLKITVGLTFSGGLIDLFFFGIMQGQEKTNWMMVIPLGIVYFIVYYFLFHFLILKFDIKTPGRKKNQHKNMKKSQNMNTEKIFQKNY